MKKIVLHGPAVDNAGLFCDAGAELTVGDQAKAGVISADRAKALVDGHQAVSATAAAQIEKAAAAPFDPSPFEVSGPKGGRYTISGPGLDAPETIRGKAAMQERVDVLRAAMPPAGPAEAGESGDQD